MKPPGLLLSALLLLPLGAAAEALPQEQPEASVVTGHQPGPPLWRVQHGTNTLWIFPHLSVSPRDITWDGAQVLRVLDGSQEYIGMPRQEADSSLALLLNPLNLLRGYRLLRRLQRHADGATLEQSLAPDVYARFAALKARHFPDNDEIDELRPIFAGGRMAVLIREQSALTEDSDIRATLWKAARRGNMKLTNISVSMALEGSFAELAERGEALLDKLPREQEQDCFEQRIRHFEQDLTHLKRRANAWAQGNVDAFRKVPLVGAQSNTCADMILQGTAREPQAETQARLEQMWLAAAQTALATNVSTFAVLDIDELLSVDGPISKLRSLGYEIEEP